MTNRSALPARLGEFLIVVMLASFSAQAAQPTPSDANRNKKLRTTAERFENLTEISFSEAWPTIDQTIGEAAAAAGGARGFLSIDEVGQLNEQLSTIKSARQKNDRADLALSSIEAYRVLVSAVTDNDKIPTEVSLLDYAGFRYDADLKASPIRWDDMARAVSFINKTWDALSPRTKASPAAKSFQKMISEMDKAVVLRKITRRFRCNN